MKKQILIAIALLAIPVSAFGEITVYFGEDLGQGEGTRLASFPNASAARTQFLNRLSGVSTESFESFAANSSPGLLSFTGSAGLITAALSGGATVANVPTGTNGVGRYPTDGDQYLETSSQLEIVFSEPVAAFGFDGIDIGDFNGQVTITTTNGGSLLYNVGNTQNGLGGSVLFWGIIDTDNLIASIKFGNTAAGVDFFGYDRMVVGDVRQVQPPTVPAPGAVVLLGLGISLVSAIRRRIA